MNAIMVPTKEDVSFVVDLVYQMHITAKSVQSKKRIEMAALRLSILEALKQIYSMKGRSMDLKEDRLFYPFIHLLMQVMSFTSVDSLGLVNPSI